MSEIKTSLVGGFYDHGPDNMPPSALERYVEQLHGKLYEMQD